MKRYLYILCMFLGSFAQGQNLVKNPGFEKYYHLPDLIYEYGERQMDSAFICKYWYRVKGTTPDYFHINAKNIRYGIPNNSLGYYPALTDSAYMGLGILNLEGATEPISGEFTEPLEEGRRYEISFFYCFANSESYFYSDKIDVLISTDNWITEKHKPWPFYKDIVKKEIAANVIFESPVVNDGQWHKMTGYYQAKGGERYISFGIFYQNEKFGKIINEYVMNRFSWGQNQNKLESFFKKYQKDLFMHRNPHYSPKPTNFSTQITYETKKGEVTNYHYKQQFSYYFIDDVSVVEIVETSEE